MIIDGPDAKGPGAEVNADFAISGGIQGFGWIDIFAEQDIIINGPAAGTTVSYTCPGTAAQQVPLFAVHANSPCLGGDTGGDITVKAKNSFVTMTGQALEANAAGGNGNGNGGAIVVQASAKVTLDTSSLQARGFNSGTNPPCDGGSGDCGDGGTIDVRSFNNAISWLGGFGNVNPDNGASPPAGNITLLACSTVKRHGCELTMHRRHRRSPRSSLQPTDPAGVAHALGNQLCGGNPSFPAVPYSASPA